MDNHLNRHTYGFIQSRLVPFYLHLGSACAFFNLTIFAVYHPSDLLDEREAFQVSSPPPPGRHTITQDTALIDGTNCFENKVLRCLSICNFCRSDVTRLLLQATKGHSGCCHDAGTGTHTHTPRHLARSSFFLGIFVRLDLDETNLKSSPNTPKWHRLRADMPRQRIAATQCPQEQGHHFIFQKASLVFSP